MRSTSVFLHTTPVSLLLPKGCLAVVVRCDPRGADLLNISQDFYDGEHRSADDVPVPEGAHRGHHVQLPATDPDYAAKRPEAVRHYYRGVYSRPTATATTTIWWRIGGTSASEHVIAMMVPFTGSGVASSNQCPFDSVMCVIMCCRVAGHCRRTGVAR
jgi:hypothetical protein